MFSLSQGLAMCFGRVVVRRLRGTPLTSLRTGLWFWGLGYMGVQLRCPLWLLGAQLAELKCNVLPPPHSRLPEKNKSSTKPTETVKRLCLLSSVGCQGQCTGTAGQQVRG